MSLRLVAQRPGSSRSRPSSSPLRLLRARRTSLARTARSPPTPPTQPPRCAEHAAAKSRAPAACRSRALAGSRVATTLCFDARPGSTTRATRASSSAFAARTCAQRRRLVWAAAGAAAALVRCPRATPCVTCRRATRHEPRPTRVCSAQTPFRRCSRPARTTRIVTLRRTSPTSTSAAAEAAANRSIDRNPSQASVTAAASFLRRLRTECSTLRAAPAASCAREGASRSVARSAVSSTKTARLAGIAPSTLGAKGCACREARREIDP